MEKIINGKEIAKTLRLEVEKKSASLKKEYNITIGIAVVIIGNDPASEIYVRNKSKFAIQCGFNSKKIELSAEITQEEVLSLIEKLNNDKEIHGILIQLPLPKSFAKEKILSAISPHKDIDGFHKENAGLLFTDQVNYSKTLLPCTPKGSLILIKKVLGENLTGKKAVVIGSSNIVGRPMFALLLNERCTVTITHSKTKDLKKELEGADIIVIATGIPRLLTGDLIPEKAVVIDVGINRVNENRVSKIVGDVNFEEALPKVSFISPVPGGVGPMTIACLLQNTLIAACNQNNIEYSNL
jgi:methylenetetrahydrofolate dehydrogenase (NADP+)/methenyltetrahydrofolate cyclohydrolase